VPRIRLPFEAGSSHGRSDLGLYSVLDCYCGTVRSVQALTLISVQRRLLRVRATLQQYPPYTPLLPRDQSYESFYRFSAIVNTVYVANLTVPLNIVLLY
jgi:hypothetical protein